MKTNVMLENETHDDARLVELSSAGDREAFGQLVARYQSPVCAMAYSACGNVSRSEDLAQEIFITAWRELAKLKEPGKFRAWLYGIARNLINNTFRRQTRNPLASAEPLDETIDAPAPVADPTEHVMSKEEEAILWQVLAGMPEVYREPMILFYREQESSSRVAEVLGVSEEVARQRLSRGRAMLNDRVTRLIETGLRRSIPGKAFTVGVLAALPAVTLSAKAATLGATAAKGSAVAAKAALTAGFLGAVLSPLLGVAGLAASYRTELDNAQTGPERRHVHSLHRRFITIIFCFVGSLVVLTAFARPLIERHLLAELVIALVALYVVSMGAVCIWIGNRRRRIVAEMTPEELATNPTQATWEYRSKFTLLGLPLIHIRMCERMAPPTTAWIAIGDFAIGGLFAWGGLSIAPVCVGGCAIGLIPIGGLTLGAVSLGGCSIGIYSIGGLAIGWQALGGCAIAWSGAAGAIAIAHQFALGKLAQAAQANNDLASQFIEPRLFFRTAEYIAHHMIWLNAIWLLPIGFWPAGARIRERRRQAQQSKS